MKTIVSDTVKPEIMFPTIEDADFSIAIRNAVNDLNILLEQAAKKRVYLSAQVVERKTTSGFTKIECIQVLDVVKCL